jgi:hypothetical protein
MTAQSQQQAKAALPQPALGEPGLTTTGKYGTEQHTQEVEARNAAKDALYKNDPVTFKAQHPIEYATRKAHDYLVNALVDPAVRDLDPRMRAKVESHVKDLAETGLSLAQVPSGKMNEAPTVTEGIAPPGEIGLEGEEAIAAAQAAKDFEIIPGHQLVEPSGLATTKELVNIRPQDFMNKVGAEGHVYTDTVNHYRKQIHAGEDVGPASIVYDADGNIIGANGRHRALAHLQEGTERMPVEIHRQIPEEVPHKSTTPVAKEMNIGDVSTGAKGYHEQKFKTSIPVKVTWPDHPGDIHFDEVKGLNEGHALARAKSNWPGANVEVVKPSPHQKMVEDQGLVYKGELMPGAKVHMFEHPDHPGMTAAMNESDMTPASVKAKMKSKLDDFGVAPKSEK